MTEIERQLRWLMSLRLGVVTILLLTAFAIEFVFLPGGSLKPLFLLTAAAYGAALCYGLIDRWFGRRRGFIVVQLIGDAMLVSLFVRITGGIDSPMSFLYLLPITVAAMTLFRGGALVLAGLCYGFYAIAITLGQGAAGSSALQEPRRVFYFLAAHLVAMVAVALLSSSLSERLRVQGKELVERRGAVARLQALNENIIESINSGLITTDLRGLVQFVNRGGMEICDFTAAAIEGRPVEEVLGLESGFLIEARGKLLSERRFRFERYFTTHDGRRIFLGNAISNLYDRTGTPLGYIFIFQDLTEIHALEQEVRLSERMAGLGEMAAGMAHELRNPLAAISGAVQYLKTEINPEGEALELMDIVLRESQRLDHAIRDFLTFARPGDFSPEPADIVKVLDDNVKLLRRSGDFGASHVFETHYAEPTMLCEFDTNRLKQVFWNLTTNAIKAMPEGGRLTIEVDWTEHGEAVEIVFRDEGVGMDEHELQRYFQPFSSSFTEGTGLGAAIVYRLVEEHRGRIQLESEPSRGTTVRVRLPRRQPPVRRLKTADDGRLAAVGG